MFEREDKQHINLDILDQTEPYIEKGPFMTLFYLSNMYHHVHVSEDQYKCFGFKLPNKRWLISVLRFYSDDL